MLTKQIIAGKEKSDAAEHYHRITQYTKLSCKTHDILF